MSRESELAAKTRRANRPRLDSLDEGGLRDVANWLNGADPMLLKDILDDLDDEWGLG